jgi:hypothetical protein
MDADFLGTFPSCVKSMCYRIDSMKHTFNKPKIETQQLLVRVRPQAKVLLQKASIDQRKSQSAIVETLIIDGLSAVYSSSDDRIQAFLKGST